MSQNPPTQGAWRVEADTLPDMQYEHYRDTLIHETSDIKDFLASRPGRTTLVAPKGYGKTLLLIAKKKSFLEAKSGIIMAENLFIDRPTGTFRTLTRVRIDQLSMDYEFWKSLWKVAIALAAIKAFARTTKDQSLNRILVDIDHVWYKKILRDDSKYFEAGELFTDLMTQDYRSIVNILDKSNFLFPNLNRINMPIVFFIDNVDEYFRPVLEDRSPTQNPNRLFRNRNNMIWALAQIALTSAAYELEKTNHHLKIFCTMRHEAFLRMSEVESDAFQITGSRCLQIKYSPSDLEQIFLKNIEIMPQERLVEPQSTDLMSQFVGSNNKWIRNRFVPQTEHIFDFFLRHSLYRPRDLMFIGGETAKIDPPLRSVQTIQEAVDASTGAIIESIFAEMRPFFAVPVRRKLFPHILSNVLSLDQLKDATRQYARDLGEDNITDPDHEVAHPFCVLYKLGLLGNVGLEFQANAVWRQSFLQPTEIRMSNSVGLPPSPYYILHPALDQAVHDMSPGFARLYHRQNIIGKGLRWQDGTSPRKGPIIRSIQFPPEYCQAGLGLLNYFGHIVASKYPTLPVKITIEQENTTIRMLIDTPEGQRERIERTFEEYGLAITGNILPEQLLSDPLQIIELRTELRIARVRIESQKELLDVRNVEVKHLYKLIEDSTRSTHTLHGLLQQLVSQQEGAIQQALTTLQETLQRGVTSDDETMVKEALETIGKHDPTVFQRVVEIVGVGAISGAAGNHLTLWLQQIGRMLGL